jgi:hypothetical protein
LVLAFVALVAVAAILLTVLSAAGVVRFGPLAQPALADRVRAGVTIKAIKGEPTDKLPNGRQRHNYWLWLEAPPDILDQIEQVEYRWDHPEFNPRRTVSTNRATGFKDGYNGVGSVDRDIDVVLSLRDGTTVTLPFNVWRAVSGR